MKIRTARSDDLDAVKALLAQNELPVAEVDAALLEDFLVAEDARGKIVGSVGLERFGQSALLRSLRISDERDRPFRDGDRRFRQRDRSFRERDRADRKAGLALRMTSTTRAMLAGFCRREHARAPDEHAHDQGRFTT